MLDENRRLELEELLVDELRSSLRTSTAYHEAGHAVFFLAMEPPPHAFGHVEIIEDGDKIGGVTKKYSNFLYTNECRSEAASNLRVLSLEYCMTIAGPYSELLFGSSHVEEEIDLDTVLAEQNQFFGDGNKANTFMATIDKIAGRRVNAWRNLRKLTKNFLVSNRDRVDAVANALLEKGKLDYDATVAAMGGLPTLPKNNWIDRQCERIDRKSVRIGRACAA